MISNKKLWATILALSAALISGFNIFISKFAVSASGNAIVFTTLKNGLVALFLFGLIIGLKKRQEIKSLSKKQWINLILIGITGGSIPFALFFTGITQTSAVNAAIIHKTLFIWIAILAIPLLKEKISKWQWLAITAVFVANILMGGFLNFQFNIGELMILLATILWAIENIIAKKVLNDLSGLTVASARMIFGSLILLAIVIGQGNIGLFSGIDTAAWGWTLITAVLLLGYVVSWYTALKYAPASYVATLIVPATLVTNILSSVFITHTYSGRQILSTLLYLTGAAIMIIVFYRQKNVIALPEQPTIT